MKTIFDPAVRQEVEKRINSLNENSKAQWGKMNVYQMLNHCARCDDMYHGELKIRRAFIGRLIGKMILNKILRNDEQFGKGSPTSPLLKVAQTSGDLQKAKSEWLGKIGQYAEFSNPGFIHPFFGAMSKEQIGHMAYKHADHHLRQFGA